MRPTTPAAILADALHRSRYPEHPVGCSCQWAGADELEALEVYDRLVENGAHVAYDLSLPSSAPSGVRPTSRAAAESLGDLSGPQSAVLDLIYAHGSHGMTDEELNEQYPGFAKNNGYPPIGADSPRKRRDALAQSNHVYDSGRTRPNHSNRDAIVWVARPIAREAAA